MSTHKTNGFSFIELIITITLVSILLLLIFPTMHDLYGRNTSQSQADKIKTALEFARSEAIRQNTSITFCKSKSFTDCDGDWNDGQIIKNSKNVILRTFDPLPQGDVLVWQSSFSGSKNDYLTFTSTGTTDGQQGSFFYCPGNSAQNNIAIIIQQTGSMRISDRTSTGKMVVCIK